MRSAHLAAALVMLAWAASAWDSRTPGDKEGAEAALQRWTDVMGRDEHRRLWLHTLDLAGGWADADFTLTSFTTQGSLQPTNLLTADAVEQRVHSPSEFTQLPDFSYSLWDWSLGNETCPLGSPALQSVCHSFLGHMGVTNSNHFSPQTATNYAHYHGLAMARAADCQRTRTRVGSRPDLQRFVAACVNEALVLEAVGHHYLQDTWSMGHTWERWGSPNETDFPAQSIVIGGVVASFSGLIHGGRSVLQGYAPPGFDVDDALNAPAPGVNFVNGPGAAPEPGLGDMYLPFPSLSPWATQYPAQYTSLFNCAVGGVNAVLAAAGETAPRAVSAGITPVDPSTDPSCFGPRATNVALAKGYAIDFKDSGNSQHSVPLEVVASGLSVLALPVLSAPVQFDALQVGTLLRIRAVIAPDATDKASGGLGPFLGVQPNGGYNKLGAYVDPALPWPGGATRRTDPELALARQFHEAHARDWCGLFQAGAPELDLDQLRMRVGSATGFARQPACAACVEFAERHLRVGDPATYNPATSDEPLCGLIADLPGAVQYVYVPAQAGPQLTRNQLAQTWCGCDGLKIGAGTFFNQVTNQVTTGLLVRLRGPGDSVPTADVPFSLFGPLGWAPDAGSVVGLTYPKGELRQFYTTGFAPVSGDYVVTATVGGQSMRATSTVDATQVLPAPGTVIVDLSTPNDVGGSWTAVTGAVSYLARVFDVTAARILTPVQFTGSTTATLSGLSINGGHQNAFQVWSFSNDMQPADPAVPAQFNMSFNRKIVTGTVAVAPASAGVTQGGTLGLTATVTGLPTTAVTWSSGGGGLTPNGNSASWVAPMVNGVYTVTATSVANPALRASAKITVTGGSGLCDRVLTGQKFAGVWRVTSGAGIAGTGAQNCTTVPEFFNFAQAGTFTMSASGTTGTIAPMGLRAWPGEYYCGGADAFQGTNTNLTLGSFFDPTDQNSMSGTVVLQLQGSNYVPCTMLIDAVRK